MQTLEQLKNGQLKGAKHIKIIADLTEFPLEILDLADTLEVLDLSFNKLSSLPVNFYKLRKLKIAFFSNNIFTELPKVLGKCKSLEMIGFKSNHLKIVSEESLPVNTRWLILTDNQIEFIPKSLGNCNRLQKLAIAGNKIKELPVEMANCKNLELIRISANLLTNFPSWLLQLPKLSWLAFAGNPFSEMEQITNNLNKIDWFDLSLNKQLGEGASGIIYKSTLKNIDNEVAVKIFKGEVTSDGLPKNEMNASMAAGNHPNLINVLGKIINHPEQKEGLVMGLIPAYYKNLGNPPSLITCTRDVFNSNTNFTINQMLSIAKGMASVCFQLHSRGINHGDLYAHNMMYDEDGNNILGDFGAATFYNKNSAIAQPLQKIEVRAFGCLLADLLMNSKEDIAHQTIKLLTQLRDDCMHVDVINRPTFKLIVNSLKNHQ
jgi:hypothetical protein